MQFRKSVLAALALAGGAGCSPTFDWREFEPDGSGVVLAFPCKPDHHARSVTVAGARVNMEMLVCVAGDTTFALTYFDVADPTGVTAAITELRAVAAKNLGLGETPPGVAEFRVRGMTPNPQAARLVLAGRRPDGAPLRQQAAFFTKGLRVYQASVVGSQPSAEAVDTYFSSMKLPS